MELRKGRTMGNGRLYANSDGGEEERRENSVGMDLYSAREWGKLKPRPVERESDGYVFLESGLRRRWKGSARGEENRNRVRELTSGDREVVNFTRSRVRTKSKITNLMKTSQN